MLDEKLCIADFINGKPNNYIDKIIIQTVTFKGWGARIETEDLIQNIRLILLKNFKAGNYHGKGLSTYARRIAEIQCLFEIRRHYREEKYHDKWSESVIEKPDPTPDALFTLLEREKIKKVVKVMKTLDKFCRQLLILKFHKELSYQEIGQRLNITEGNARVSVHRCLNKSKEISQKIEENL